MSEIDIKIVRLMVIAGRNSKDELMSMLVKEGAKLIDLTYGKRAFKAGFFQDVLGLVPEEIKVVITCLLREPKADAILKRLIEEYDFNKANTGIAFTVPVEKVSF